MGSGGGISEAESYQMQKDAALKAEQEERAKQAAKEAKWQKAADSATVTKEGGEGNSGGVSEKKKKAGTLAGAGEATFSEKSEKLG